MLAAVAAVASSYGQGTITFQNTTATLVQKWTSPVDSTLITVPASGGKVELLWAPVGSSLGATLLDFGAFQVAGATANINPAGRYIGGTRTVGTSGNAGGIYAVVVRGWTGAALTWNDAVAGGAMLGRTTVWTIDTGDPTTTPAGSPAVLSTATGFSGFTLQPVPEPTSMALAGLGAASLLIFRRRK